MGWTFRHQPEHDFSPGDEFLGLGDLLAVLQLERCWWHKTLLVLVGVSFCVAPALRPRSAPKVGFG